MDSEEEFAEPLDADAVEESGDESTHAEDEEEDDIIVVPDEIVAEETIVIVPEESWQTPDILSRFEISRIISIRAAEIENSPHTCLVPLDSDDPIKLAKAELEARKCPLIVSRQVARIPTKINGKEMAVIYIECRNPNNMAHGEIY